VHVQAVLDRLDVDDVRRHDDEIAEVRLDVTLEAAEPGLRITTATAHLLGALRWLGRAEAALVLAGDSAACHCPITGENPLVGLADLACAPGGRRGGAPAGELSEAYDQWESLSLRLESIAISG